MSQTPDHALRQPALTKLIEQFVTEYLGQTWRVVTFKDLNDLASHPSALLSDGQNTVFAKLSLGGNALDQLEVEQNGLRLLRDLVGVAVPTPIGVISSDEGAVLLLEAVHAIDRTLPQWRHIGQALAKIHCVHGAQFGLPTQGYFGPIYQDNRPLHDWPTFYVERRLWPRLIGAIDSGHLPIIVAKKVEQLIARCITATPNLIWPFWITLNRCLTMCSRLTTMCCRLTRVFVSDAIYGACRVIWLL